jgi:hypothetical protein
LGRILSGVFTFIDDMLDVAETLQPFEGQVFGLQAIDFYSALLPDLRMTCEEKEYIGEGYGWGVASCEEDV